MHESSRGKVPEPRSNCHSAGVTPHSPRFTSGICKRLFQSKTRINKMWSIHTMQHYSALTRKEILTRATTRMNLGDIMLREISQTQKDKSCVIPLT